ncbi:MAG: glycosyltransferase family 4 protein [Patescibacteria group bacterium]|jgi:glycosyltransferase involved in cell wall biosynthesis
MTKKQLLAQKLAELERKVRVIYVGSYIPRECGIATFTKDLTNAINMLNPENLAEIIALNEPLASRKYPWEVKYHIDQKDKKSYLKAADYINQSSCEIVNIQHEFGIFGGKDGEYILLLMDLVKKPIITTLHTVLSSPKVHMKHILKKIADKSDAMVVMIEEAAERLVKEYGVPAEKIVIIPHGVPDISFSHSTSHKKKLRLDGKTIISTFGLLSSGKGIENMILAMPEIIKKNKDAKYLLIGETHPVIRKIEGEKYRQSLEKLCKDLKIVSHVKFINRYLSLDELIKYLQATDVYVTPYLNPEQITSGTLAYAVGAGKPCVSTPYIYAEQVLAGGRGVIVPFRNPEKISEQVIELLSNREKRIKMAKSAYLYGRNMTWHNVAFKYLNLFRYIIKNNES